jgi:hypothetical protein
MADSTDSLPGRVNELERDVGTMKYRLLQLEQLPPKVSELERAFSVMDVNLTYIKQTAIETKLIVDELNNNQKVLTGELRGLPRALRLVTGLIATAGIGVTIVLFFQ